MDKQILDLLSEMNVEIKAMKSDIDSMKSNIHSLKSDSQSMKSDIDSIKSEMHNRFYTIEAKLEGIANKFELTNESRINDIEFVIDKVNKLEKDVYILKK